MHSGPGLTGRQIWQQLLAGNQRFVQGRSQGRNLPELRRRLAQGQQPQAAVLCCSDSRVPPELIFDQSLGDLFVVRTAGDVADRAALGSLEYAAEVLRSPVLVVLGHEQCGAVAAAASSGRVWRGGRAASASAAGAGRSSFVVGAHSHIAPRVHPNTGRVSASRIWSIWSICCADRIAAEMRFIASISDHLRSCSSFVSICSVTSRESIRRPSRAGLIDN